MEQPPSKGSHSVDPAFLWPPSTRRRGHRSPHRTRFHRRRRHIHHHRRRRIPCRRCPLPLHYLGPAHHPAPVPHRQLRRLDPSSGHRHPRPRSHHRHPPHPRRRHPCRRRPHLRQSVSHRTPGPSSAASCEPSTRPAATPPPVQMGSQWMPRLRRMAQWSTAQTRWST